MVEPEDSGWGMQLATECSLTAFLFVLWAMLSLNVLWLLAAVHAHTASLLKSGRNYHFRNRCGSVAASRCTVRSFVGECERPLIMNK